MQTENSFIAQQCDQAGEVCELVSDLRPDPNAIPVPVLCQYRMAPNWNGDKRYWSTWEKCSAESADNYERLTPYNDWHYEVRRLYAAPADAEIAALKEQLRTDAANIKNMRREIRYLLETSQEITTSRS